MARLGKYLTICLVIFLTLCSLLIVDSISAQTTQSANIPIIITTPTPTPSPILTPAPTPTSNIALGYNEVSRQTIGDDTKILLEVNAQYNFGNAVTLNYQNFNLTIITNATHGIPPVTFREQTGIAKPLETGSVTIDSTNRAANFSLTFQFQTKRETFYGDILDFTGYDVTYTENTNSLNSVSPSPTVPEFPITAILIAVLAVVSLLLIIGKRKQSFNY
jgi:hypothetical protein